MNNEMRVSQIRNYAAKYQFATDNGLTAQARFWLKCYENAVAALGFDPLL